MRKHSFRDVEQLGTQSMSFDLACNQRNIPASFFERFEEIPLITQPKTQQPFTKNFFYDNLNGSMIWFDNWANLLLAEIILFELKLPYCIYTDSGMDGCYCIFAYGK